MLQEIYCVICKKKKLMEVVAIEVGHLEYKITGKCRKCGAILAKVLKNPA